IAAICIATPRASASPASSALPEYSTSTPTAGGRSGALRCRYTATGVAPARTATRLTTSFSPILADSSSTVTATVRPGVSSAASSASALAGRVASACSTRLCARAMKSAFLATKSVSQFSSSNARPECATSPLADILRALDAQDLDGLLEVAARLLQRLLTVQHPGAGQIAELLDVRGSEVRHTSLSSDCDRSGQASTAGGLASSDLLPSSSS